MLEKRIQSQQPRCELWAIPLERWHLCLYLQMQIHLLSYVSQPFPSYYSHDSASSGGAGIAGGAAVVDAARIAVLEEKVAKLSEELTAELRSKNDTMSQLIKTKLQSEAGDRSLLAKEEEYVAFAYFPRFHCIV